MRVPSLRVLALVAGVAVVASCDGAPTTTRLGQGISGGPTGTAPIVPPAPGSVDSTAPIVLLDTPVVTPRQLANVGDSILVVMRLHDERQLQNATLAAYREVGDPNLGTYQKLLRYELIEIPPQDGVFRSGLTDTTIKRYLKPVQPVDTTLGPLLIEAIVLDGAGNADTATRLVDIVAGPKVRIIAPSDSVPVGQPVQIQVEITHPDGIAIDSIRVVGDVLWPTRLDTTIVHTFPAGTRAVTDTATVIIPADALLRSRVTITATARDVNRNPGSAAPLVVFTRGAGERAPRVFQTVPARMEKTDSITVTASGDGIRSIGRVLRDSAGNLISRDSVVYATPTSNRVQKLPLLDSLGLQGKRLDIISFAWDNSATPKIGYSMAAGTSIPNETEGAAFRDTTLVTFGRTYAPPRSGVMGDVVVDPGLGNAFLSNTSRNLLEVWDNTNKVWSETGVPVGAQPWGLFQSINPDTLLVANSGATTISRVFIGTSDKTQMREALNRRIRTRDIVIYIVQFVRDPNTGKIRLIRQPNVSYSDRPQYLVESITGRIFYSTKPTEVADPGTIRWLDPSQPFPDPQQITSYVELGPQSDDVTYYIFHADSVRIGSTPPSTLNSDTLFIWDHPYGQLGPTIAAVDSFPNDAVNKIRALGSDVFTLINIDPNTLALTDTTFVAASGDRTWIAFGEGNTSGGPIVGTSEGKGRLMLVNDPTPWPGPGICPNALLCSPGFFSPAITVRDIVHNADEQVFGVALDRTGLQVVAHGQQTYMAAVDLPFHLRLDGVYDSFDNGAGVAYHPQANSTLSAADERIAFTATAGGVVEVVDVAHYYNRGRFITKGNLYGSLRVTGPLPGDNVGLTCPGDINCVTLKIFGLTSAGMIVIDVRASDIKP